jgi:hypothetical protein
MEENKFSLDCFHDLFILFLKKRILIKHILYNNKKMKLFTLKQNKQ